MRRVCLGSALPLVLLAGCGGGVGGVESALEKQIREQADQQQLLNSQRQSPPGGPPSPVEPDETPEVEDVDCPGDAKLEKGSRFLCVTKGPGGDVSGRVYVRMLTAEKFKWEFRKGAPKPAIKAGFETRAKPPFSLVKKVTLTDPTVRRLCKGPRVERGSVSPGVKREEITSQSLFITCEKSASSSASHFVAYRVYVSEHELQEGEFNADFQGPEDTRFRNGPVYVGFQSGGIDKNLEEGEGVKELPRELSRACHCGRPAKSSVR